MPSQQSLVLDFLALPEFMIPVQRLLKPFLYTTLIYISTNFCYAESLAEQYNEIKLFTDPEQRKQLNVLRKKLVAGEVIEELPTKVEEVKEIEVKLLPQITFKGMVKRKGHKTVIWVEDKNNLQGQQELGDKLSIVEIEANKIKIDYRDKKGIQLEPNQVYVPSEEKTYENYLYNREKVVITPLVEKEKAKPTIKTKEKDSEDIKDIKDIVANEPKR